MVVKEWDQFKKGTTKRDLSRSSSTPKYNNYHPTEDFCIKGQLPVRNIVRSQPDHSEPNTSIASTILHGMNFYCAMKPLSASGDTSNPLCAIIAAQDRKYVRGYSVLRVKSVLLMKSKWKQMNKPTPQFGQSPIWFVFFAFFIDFHIVLRLHNLRVELIRKRVSNAVHLPLTDMWCSTAIPT